MRSVSGKIITRFSRKRSGLSLITYNYCRFHTSHSLVSIRNKLSCAKKAKGLTTIVTIPRGILRLGSWLGSSNRGRGRGRLTLLFVAAIVVICSIRGRSWRRWRVIGVFAIVSIITVVCDN
jgi:hypothetical protein